MIKNRHKAKGIRQKVWNPDKSGNLLIVLLISVIVFGAGCQQEGIRQRVFNINTSRGDAVNASVVLETVKLLRVEAARPFSDKAFVYRTKEDEYEIDYYNSFIASPDEMVRQRTYDWLIESGVFEDVIRWDDARDTKYYLKGYIKSLYGDFTAESGQSAVMCIEFELRDRDHNSVLKKEYKSQVEFEDRKVMYLVEAYGKCLEDILGRLEKDINRVYKFPEN